VEGGTIRIESRLNADRLLIAISNSGSRHEVEAQGSSGSAGSNTKPSRSNGKARGVGLTNTEERLKTLYGNDQRFLLRWPEAGGCEATIEMPMRRAAQAVEGGVCAR
jgi:sensor histidine kinase YesM